MKLATLADGGRDGTLVVVSRGGTTFAPAKGIAATLQDAIENWAEAEGRLQELSARVEQGSADGQEVLDVKRLAAPLPRAWQWLDGSAYPSHGELMDQVIGVEVDSGGHPLMYQGVSNTFYGPREEVPFLRESDGIDFEGEFGMIVDEVPAGTSPEDCMGHIKLLVQINDWSLRALAGREMKTGFGWIQAKPPCGMAPFAITPDELGDYWKNGRITLDLAVDWNDKRFGKANGDAMDFGFHELVAHAAYSRTLCAGTVIGSGTVSNANFREVGSSCIAERRGIEIVDEGEPRTDFMKFGDTVRMAAVTKDDDAPFGVLEQKVIKA